MPRFSGAERATTGSAGRAIPASVAGLDELAGTRDPKPREDMRQPPPGRNRHRATVAVTPQCPTTAEATRRPKTVRDLPRGEDQYRSVFRNGVEDCGLPDR